MTKKATPEQYAEDILNAAIDIRKEYFGARTDSYGEYIIFNNGKTNITNKLDEIKEKSQELLSLLFELNIEKEK
ncbi:MAG TPA: hypothetical protein PKL04_00745 [Methanofastidiosum sp.]|nr:hypothetical protein [Methanofastidiosum sp.]